MPAGEVDQFEFHGGAAMDLGITGLPGGTRTPDPQLRRLVLYPVELRAVAGSDLGGSDSDVCLKTGLSSEGGGRGGGIRTRDLLVPNQLRYQAALRPEQLRIVAGV